MAEITQRDIAKAKAKQSEVFKNPAYLREAHDLAEQFAQVGADGTQLSNKLKNLLIMQGEWDFEQEVKDYPHGMEVPRLGKGLDDNALSVWLQDQFAQDEYILMPTSAMGKYKEHWNWIYFKEKDQAMLFKLTWY